MNSPLDETLLEQYLDRICAEFWDCPAVWQAEQREELLSHLTAMAKACQELGSEPDQSLREALQQFGEPAQVGKAMARKYWPADVLPGSFALAFGTALVWLIVTYGTISGGFFLVDN